MPGLLHTSGGVPQTPTRRWERKRGGCCFNELTPPRYLRRKPSNTWKAPLVTCRATLDVPKELVRYLARLLRAHRRALGTRANTRSLTCYNQAILILRHYRDRTDPTRLATDHTISRATAYRYIDEGTTVLANQAPDLHQALQQAQEHALGHLVLDGIVLPCDRCSEKTTGVKGKQIDLCYSGKTHTHGGNVQGVMTPDGFPLFVSEVEPGSVHDLTAAR